ncbi:MAG TPA: peptide-binding protein [Tepidisphaeraceae bacterium]|nr:peptide-binding protein [Tepidisphaeraceae bacterium]
MENRFGIKDLFLFCLLIILIISVWLAMVQFDRQYELIRTLKDSTDTQTRTLAEINRRIEQGIRTVGTVSSDNPTTEPAADDPFSRILAARKQPGYTQGDWCVSSFPVNLSKVTPYISTDVYAYEIDSHVLEGLITRDPVTLDYQPLIAKSWTTSKDGLTITVSMRHDVTFSDGQPCTADDVVYTFDLVMNPKVDAPRDRAYLDNIASVTKTDDYTVVFKFKKPYFQELDLIAGLSILPKHFYSKYPVDQINLLPGLLMGTGPYRLENPATWTPGQPLALVRNDNYWGVAPAFDRLVFREINNEVADLTAFTNGETDLYSPTPEQYQKLLKMPDVVSRTQHYEYSTPADGFNFIGWNEMHDGKPTRFADKRLRQAMTMLINRPQIAQQIFLGYANVADGPFPPSSKQHMPALKPMPYDPSKALAILKELGYKSVNSQLIGADGQPFRFKLTYPGGHPTTERLVLFIRDELAAVGIQLEPDPLDWSVFAQRMNNRDFDAITLGWSGTVENDIYQVFDSSQIKDQGDNFVSYSNPKLDKLIETARQTVNEKERMPMWQQCDQILHDDQPYTFLFNMKQLVFLDKRIQNVQILPLGINGRDEWWVPKSQWKWEK